MSLFMSDVIGQYDIYLRVERGLSELTRNAYKFDLKKFVEYLIKNHAKEPVLSKIDKFDIKNYLSILQMDKEYKSATLCRTIASLRNFFKYCVEQELLKESPAISIHNPKQAKKLPIYLIDSELKKLFETPDKSELKGIRDYTIIVTLAYTGMRLKEIVGLNLKSIDFERNTIKVLGKGAKERLIPMNKVVRETIEMYLDQRQTTEDTALFLNKFGKRLSGRAVEYLVREYVLKSGINKDKVSPHKLRHTFATLLHLNDVDILEIQRLLGHSAITSTQIYTHTNPLKLKKAVDTLTGS